MPMHPRTRTTKTQYTDPSHDRQEQSFGISPENPPITNNNSTRPPPHGRKFPQSILNQLNGTDLRLLEAIYYDTRCQGKKSPTGARYSIKPQAYWAKILEVTRETISRSVSKLSRLGILDVTHRKKKHGQWQTNLYKIVSWIWWRFRQAIHSIRTAPHRVTGSATISTPMREKKNQEEQKGGVLNTFTQEIMARWKQRGIWPPDMAN